jgi:uncharacterized membrane protein (UPF0182 family)
MEPTLNGALNALFGTQQLQERAAQAPGRQPELGQARTQLEEAQKAIQQGDWEKFGRAMQVLKRLLSEPPR